MAYQQNPAAFVRKGQNFMKTGVTAEAMHQGEIFDITTMTEYDANDTWLGYLVNDKDFSVEAGGEIASGTEVYYIDLAEAKGAEVLVSEANDGAIAAGALCAVTTGGEVITYAYVDAAVATDTIRDVVGIAMAIIAQNDMGFMKVR